MAMKRLLLLLALGALGCEQTRDDSASVPAKAVPVEANAGQAPQSKAPLVLPMPKEQKELDRLILAGYTPHAGHLHPPGVKNCPLAKEGNEAVM